MNKTININLASTFFHIDEDAYKVLKAYLKRLETAFKNSQGKEEILGDIEARISELFQECKKHKDYVINRDDVSIMIETLGQPEDFVIEDEEPQASRQQTSHEKKLFRDGEDQYIGGVASGMGHYFGIDTVWIRLIWLVLGFFSGGTFIFLYILFWILIPKAVSTADKLKMKGKPVNIVNIERKIKEEFENVSERIKNVDYDEAKSSLKKKSKNFFNFLENLLGLLLKSLSKIIGLALIVVAMLSIISLFITLISFFVMGIVDWPFTIINSLLDFNGYPIWIPITFLFLCLIIPFVFVFILGLKLVTPKSNAFGFAGRLVLLGIWISSLMFLIIFGFNEFRSHEIVAKHNLEEILPLKNQDTLKLTLRTTNYKRIEHSFITDFSFYYDEIGEKWLYGDKIKVNIKQNTDPTLKLKILKIADGKSFETALTKAKAINFNWELSGTIVKLDSRWETPIKNKYHNQHIEVNLLVPEGQKIQISKKLTRHLDRYIPNDQGFN